MEAEYVYAIYLLLGYCTCIAGSVTINSSGINADVAPVCCGDELEINCTIRGRVLEWNITLMSPENTTLESIVDSVTLSFQPHTQTVSNGSISFIVSRISPRGNTHPLISRLLISPATSIVNGTLVVCADRETRANSSTRVNVVRNNSPLTDNAVRAVHIVNFTSLSELRGSAFINLSVLLQLNGTNPSFPYRINIVPEERNISVKNVGPIFFELMVRYDTWYNMSIMICGELSSAPLIGLYYSKCGTGPVIIDYDGHLQGIFDNITDCPHVTSQAPTGLGTADDATETFGLTGATLGVILGTLSSALVFGTAVILCAIIGSVLLVKRKGLLNSDRGRQQNECQETTADYSSLHHHDDQPDTKNAKEGLVYAEVGHRNIPPSFLNLDDTPIEYVQINHKLHTDKNNRALPLKPVDKSLCVNLDTLLIQLRQQVTAKWYQFGVRAGIHRDVLDNFAKQCSPNDCIVEMLDYWLRNSKQPPTWKDVARILKEINLTQLGQDIDEFYKTGELPVKINMNWVPPIHPAAIKSEPPPPPTNREEKYSESTIQTESEALVPALPPKPNNNWSMTNVPARPPKPTPKSS